jgi:hypothetical protein
VQEYIDFLAGLKPDRSRVKIGLIAGPAEPVVVGKDGDRPIVRPSCQGANGIALPALRLDAVRSAFDGASASVCDPSAIAKGLAAAAPDIIASGPGGCLKHPPLTVAGAVACDARLPACRGGGEQASCLAEMACVAETVRFAGTSVEQRVPLPRCPADLFGDGEQRDCGATCPCWRVVPDRPSCGWAGGPPLRLEVLRAAPAEPDTATYLRCRSAEFEWGSAEMAKAPICGGEQ